MIKYIAMFLLMPSLAMAQQPQQLTPSQAAVQITTVINSMATSLEQVEKQLNEANARNAELQKQLDAAKSSQAPVPLPPEGKPK